MTTLPVSITASMAVWYTTRKYRRFNTAASPHSAMLLPVKLPCIAAIRAAIKMLKRVGSKVIINYRNTIKSPCRRRQRMHSVLSRFVCISSKDKGSTSKNTVSTVAKRAMISSFVLRTVMVLIFGRDIYQRNGGSGL